jgi:threonine dehydrogenase-like Zn-dependent dehydrogenase
MGGDAFETLGEGEAERIHAALGGAPDLVLECVGVVGMLQKAVELVRPQGTITSLGFCPQLDPILPSLATYKEVTLRFSFAYSLREFTHAVDMFDRGRVEPRLMVSETVSLARLPDAFESLRVGAQQTKLQVDPWAED